MVAQTRAPSFIGSADEYKNIYINQQSQSPE